MNPQRIVVAFGKTAIRSDLIVSLNNPDGTGAIVFDRQPVQEIHLRSVPV